MSLGPKPRSRLVPARRALPDAGSIRATRPRRRARAVRATRMGRSSQAPAGASRVDRSVPANDDATDGVRPKAAEASSSDGPPDESESGSPRGGAAASTARTERDPGIQPAGPTDGGADTTVNVAPDIDSIGAALPVTPATSDAAAPGIESAASHTAPDPTSLEGAPRATSALESPNAEASNESDVRVPGGQFGKNASLHGGHEAGALAGGEEYPGPSEAGRSAPAASALDAAEPGSAAVAEGGEGGDAVAAHGPRPERVRTPAADTANVAQVPGPADESAAQAAALAQGVAPAAVAPIGGQRSVRGDTADSPAEASTPVENAQATHPARGERAANATFEPIKTQPLQVNEASVADLDGPAQRGPLHGPDARAEAAPPAAAAALHPAGTPAPGASAAATGTGEAAGEPPGAQRPSPERAAAVLDQVKIHLRPGVRTATLQLEPESLGRLRIDVRVHDGQLTAELRVERPEALAALEKHVPELRAALASSGFEGDRVDVQLGFERDREPAADGDAPHSGHTGDESGADSTPVRSARALRDRLARQITERGVDTYA